jgi:hypothetical protein
MNLHFARGWILKNFPCVQLMFANMRKWCLAYFRGRIIIIKQHDANREPRAVKT